MLEHVAKDDHGEQQRHGIRTDKQAAKIGAIEQAPHRRPRKVCGRGRRRNLNRTMAAYAAQYCCDHHEP